MPTYTVRTANVDLREAQQHAIADAITQVHSRSTGAPGDFAQGFFEDAPAGAHFIGGQPNRVPHVYVHGLIRAGRTPEQKRDLVEAISARVREAAGVGGEDIWVSVQEIAPEQTIEFGRMLPQPGAQAAWRQGFSPEKIAILQRAGVAA